MYVHEYISAAIIKTDIGIYTVYHHLFQDHWNLLQFFKITLHQQP